MTEYVISEVIHCGHEGTYNTLEEAINELERRKDIPHDEEPNKCPCMSWRTCSKEYEVQEYKKGKLTKRKTILVTSKNGNKWLYKGGGYI